MPTLPPSARHDLTDTEWSLLAPLLPAPSPRGRPRTWELRSLVNGIFFRIRTGCPWRDVPQRYGPWWRVYHLYIVQVKAETSMHPGDAVYGVGEYSGQGRPRKPGYRTKPIRAEMLAQSLPKEQYRPVSWRHGTKGMMTSRFVVVRVRPANRNIPRNPDGTLPVVWLLVEWPSQATAPTDYWLSTLPEDTPIEQLVRLGKIRWRIEHDYRELKHGLGLDHFEGRHWLGWHHHTTLVTAAHLSVTEQRLAAADPKVLPVV